MNPVTKALWFIESHFAQEITLDDLADVARVSPECRSTTLGLGSGWRSAHVAVVTPRG